MPKSSYKKRKRDNKKDGGSEAKKSKTIENESVADNECDPASKLPAAAETEKGFENIDELLEENATRNNLTAINVKSILHVSYMNF